jgi:uncharacterized protein YbjT (DUF2867 family)
VFVAGASGAIGAHLVPLLIGAGHEVIGTARSAERADQMRAQGAEAVALDLMDAAAVRGVVRRASPDAIVHPATAIADARFGRSLDNGLRDDESAADPGHRRAAGRGHEAGPRRNVLPR